MVESCTRKERLGHATIAAEILPSQNARTWQHGDRPVNRWAITVCRRGICQRRFASAARPSSRAPSSLNTGSLRPGRRCRQCRGGQRLDRRLHQPAHLLVVRVVAVLPTALLNLSPAASRNHQRFFQDAAFVRQRHIDQGGKRPSGQLVAEPLANVCARSITGA